MKPTAAKPTPAATPARYWPRGLHDAHVTSAKMTDLPVDWSSDTPRWNRLEWKLDATGALFDTAVTAITFYNCTVLSGDLSAITRPHTWWFSDTMEETPDGFLLTVTFSRGRDESFALRLRFTDAEVTRGSRNTPF